MEVKAELFMDKVRGERVEVVVEAPLLPWRDVVKVLIKAGFRVVRQRGSHLIPVKDEHIIPIPKHGEIERGLLVEIMAEASLTRKNSLNS